MIDDELFIRYADVTDEVCEKWHDADGDQDLESQFQLEDVLNKTMPGHNWDYATSYKVTSKLQHNLYLAKCICKKCGMLVTGLNYYTHPKTCEEYIMEEALI